LRNHYLQDPGTERCQTGPDQKTSQKGTIAFPPNASGTYALGAINLAALHNCLVPRGSSPF